MKRHLQFLTYPMFAFGSVRVQTIAGQDHSNIYIDDKVLAVTSNKNFADDGFPL